MNTGYSEVDSLFLVKYQGLCKRMDKLDLTHCLTYRNSSRAWWVTIHGRETDSTHNTPETTLMGTLQALEKSLDKIEEERFTKFKLYELGPTFFEVTFDHGDKDDLSIVHGDLHMTSVVYVINPLQLYRTLMDVYLEGEHALVYEATTELNNMRLHIQTGRVRDLIGLEMTYFTVKEAKHNAIV